MKVVSLYFGSLAIVSAVSNPIFEIKATEYKAKIYTPMFYVSGKHVISFVSMSAIAYPKFSGGGLGE